MAFIIGAAARVAAQVGARALGGAARVGSVAARGAKTGVGKAGAATSLSTNGAKIAPVAPKGGIVPEKTVGEAPALMSSVAHDGKTVVAPAALKTAQPAKAAETAKPGEVAKSGDVAKTAEAEKPGEVGKVDKPDEVGKPDAAPAKPGGIMGTIGNITTVGGLGMMAMQVPGMFKGGDKSAQPDAPSASAQQQALSDPGYMPAYGSAAVSAPTMGGVVSPGNVAAQGVVPAPSGAMRGAAAVDPVANLLSPPIINGPRMMM